MKHEESELAVLRSIDTTKNQKTIAGEIGYSIGKVNYVLKGLIEKGFIKAERFINSDKKAQYKYLLTEKGFKEKVALTESYIIRKKKEYDDLQADLEAYKQEGKKFDDRQYEA